MMSISTTQETTMAEACTPENLHREFRTLVSGCGVYDHTSGAIIRVCGEDRLRWLNGMVTNNVRDLPADRGVYAFLLNPQGRIQSDLYVFNRGDFLLVQTESSQLAKLLEIFERYIIMDDVEVANVSSEHVGVRITGPETRKVLADAGIIVTGLEALQLVNLLWHDLPITLIRSDAPFPDSYELWVAPSGKEALWNALLKAGAACVGSEALELLRIAQGVPSYGQDIREKDLPQETEQTRALNFSKGCYIGQEIVERIRSRGNVHRTFTGFLVDGPLPAPGARIQSENKDVGEITSTASIPFNNGGKRVALGYIRREAAAQKTPLSAGGARLTVSSVPFAEFSAR